MSEFWAEPVARSPSSADSEDASADASPAKQAFDFVESCIGIVFCWAIGGLALLLPLCIAFGPAVWAMQKAGRSMSWSAVTVPLALFFYYVHSTLFPCTFRAFGEFGPLGINTALQSPRWPVLLRPFAALWWLLMFLVGVFLAMSLEMSTYLTADELRTAPIPIHDPTPLNPILFYASGVGIVFAGNTFLLLAVAAFTRNERVLRFCWRLRVPIDCIAVIVPTWLIRQHMS